MKNVVLGLTLLCIFGGIAAHKIAGGKNKITDEQKLSELAGNVTVHLAKLGEQEKGTFEFVRIHEATYQTVGGSLYELKADIKENNQESTCDIKLYERPWEDYVKLDVECGEGEKRVYQYISPAKVITKRSAQFGRLFQNQRLLDCTRNSHRYSLS